MEGLHGFGGGKGRYGSREAVMSVELKIDKGVINDNRETFKETADICRL